MTSVVISQLLSFVAISIIAIIILLQFFPSFSFTSKSTFYIYFFPFVRKHFLWWVLPSPSVNELNKAMLIHVYLYQWPNFRTFTSFENLNSLHKYIFIILRSLDDLGNNSLDCIWGINLENVGIYLKFLT